MMNSKPSQRERNSMTSRIYLRLQLWCSMALSPKLFYQFHKFRSFTMMPRHVYVKNLDLVLAHRHVPGAVVECGTWRGGMIAGIAAVLGNEREYYLYDGFEGLPKAQEIDGAGARAWQENKDSPYYFDNCRAEMLEAENAMKMSGARKYHIVKGWFNKTLTSFPADTPIAILRLDGDWYESTMACLENLYGKVVPGGIIIIDDYHAWDGCSRAIHEFLQREGLNDRVCQWRDNVAYILKRGDRSSSAFGDRSS